MARYTGQFMVRALPLLLLLLPAPTQATFNPRENLDAGRYLRVLSEAEAALKANPGNALAWAAKSQAHSALMQFGEAQTAAAKALSLKPDLPDALLARGTATAATAIQQRNFGSLRKAASALEDFKRAAELDPAYVAAWNSLGLAYQQLPGILGGSTREALRCADRLTRVAPARGHLLKGMVLALDERWGQAEPFLTQAIDLAPRDPQVVYGYLDALSQSATREALGREAWKHRLAQEARRLWPGVKNSPRGLQAVADALLDAGEGQEAWGLAEGALETSEAPSLVRLQLGKIAARSNLHLEQGLEHLNRVVAEPLEGGTGGHANAYWRRAQVLKSLGRLPEARKDVQAALSRDPNHSGAKRLLAELRKSR
jgi:tetratricopeptide (TPR) repeat protein